MSMTKEAMRAKIVAAYFTRTGKTVSADSDIVILIDLCQGIIEEIVANAVVKVNVVGGSSAGEHTGVIES